MLNLLEVSRKELSKYEFNNILTCERRFYISPFKYCGVDFMADILEAKKNDIL